VIAGGRPRSACDQLAPPSRLLNKPRSPSAVGEPLGAVTAYKVWASVGSAARLTRRSPGGVPASRKLAPASSLRNSPAPNGELELSCSGPATIRSAMTAHLQPAPHTRQALCSLCPRRAALAAHRLHFGSKAPICMPARSRSPISRVSAQAPSNGSLMLSRPVSTWPARCRSKLGSDSTEIFRSYQPKESSVLQCQTRISCGASVRSSVCLA